MSATGTVTVPGPGGTSVSLSFTGTANIGLAQQIANALAAASGAGTLVTGSPINYTGGSIPLGTPGQTEELVLNASVSGSFTVPPAASGVTEVLILPPDDTNAITIHGSPNLSILGGGGNVTVIDPDVIDLGNDGSTTNTDLVVATFADSPYEIIMRAGNESVIASGSGTIFGSTGRDSINLLGAGSGTNNLVVSESPNDPGDIVQAGAGNVTIDNLAAAAHAQDFGYFGSLSVDDLGTGDSISGGFGSLVVTAGGSDAQISGLGAITVDAAGGAGGDTVAFGPAGGVFYSSAVSTSGDIVFTGTGNVSINPSNTNNDTIIGDTGPLTVNAGSADNLVVFSGPSLGGTGLDFIGGPGSSTVVGSTGNDSVSGDGPLAFISNTNESVTGTGGLGGSTMFGATGSYLDFANTAGSMLYLGAAGNETLNAAGSTGFLNAFAGAATSESIVGGDNNSFSAGAGSDTFTGGTGTNIYTFSGNELGSSADVLTSFLSGTNNQAFITGGADTVSQSDPSQTNYTLTLNDGTTIEFAGLTGAQVQGHVFEG